MITKTKLKNAIKDSGGIIKVISGRLGVTRKSVYKAFERFPEASELLKHEREELNDDARDNIRNEIKSGNESTSRWYLSSTDPEFRPKQDVDVVTGDIEEWKKFREGLHKKWKDNV